MVNGFKIPVDVIEFEDSYLVIADIPGVEKENILITGSEDSITIKAIRRDIQNGKYMMVERFNGSMTRSLKFKHFINLNSAKAYLENGVLKIYLPKAKNEFIIDSCFKIVII